MDDVPTPPEIPEHALDVSLASDDRAYSAAALARDRLAAGAPLDDRITREAVATIAREFQARPGNG